MDWGSWIDRVDWVQVARGAGTGFFILVIAGLLVPVVGQLNPWAAAAWIVVGSLLGLVASAWRVGSAPSPALTGAIAALFSFTLLLPLFYINRQALPLRYIALYAMLALLVGGVTGFVMGRRNAGHAE